MSDLTMNTKNRLVRYAMVLAAAAAVSVPLVSQRLRAQDEPAPAAEAPAADEAKPEQDAPAPAADEAQSAAAQDEPADTDAPQAADASDDEAQPAAAGNEAPGADAEKTDAAPEAGDASKVVVRAGEVKVTVGDIEAFLAARPPEEQQQIRQHFAANPSAKRQFVNDLLEMKLLAHEGERLKLDQQPKVQKQLKHVREQIMAGAMVASLGAEGEAADKAYFEEHKDDFSKVQARHILVATRSTDPNSKKKPLSDAEAKKKAEEIRAKLENGEDFAALAKAESDDPGSKDTGGSYTFGRVGPGRMVPAFENAAFGLKENEISQPVKTEFGYHVIQLQKRIPVTYEEARAQIGDERLKSKLRELMGGEPEYDESFFDAAAAPAQRGPSEKPASRKGAK